MRAPENIISIQKGIPCACVLRDLVPFSYQTKILVSQGLITLFEWNLSNIRNAQGNAFKPLKENEGNKAQNKNRERMRYFAWLLLDVQLNLCLSDCRKFLPPP